MSDVQVFLTLNVKDNRNVGHLITLTKEQAEALYEELHTLFRARVEVYSNDRYAKEFPSDPFKGKEVNL